MNAVAEKVAFQPEQKPREVTIEEAIEAMKHFACQQNPQEIQTAMNLIKGKSSLLEIGSNYGGSLKLWASVLAPKSHIVSVDLPDKLQQVVAPIYSLKSTCEKLAAEGHRVELVLENSHEPKVVNHVRQWAPYDFVFIDGDHSYEGVKQDWNDYGPMGRIVGFHDICGGTEGCVKFWNELKAEGKYRTLDINYPQYLPVAGIWMNLGIGIVFRES